MFVAPAFLIPNAIGRGGPFLGIVANTHTSSPACDPLGSFAVSGIKNKTGSLSRSRGTRSVLRQREKLRLPQSHAGLLSKTTTGSPPRASIDPHSWPYPIQA